MNNISNNYNYNELKTILLNSKFIKGEQFKNKINRHLPYKVVENKESIQIQFGSKNSFCGIIQIEKELGEVEILSFGYQPRCTTPEIPKYVGTHILLQEMLNVLIDFIKKQSLNIKTILFTDNSSKSIYDVNGEEYTSWLADSYRILSGKTWYQVVMSNFLVQLKDKQIRIIAENDMKRYMTLMTKDYDFNNLFLINDITILTNKEKCLGTKLWKENQDKKVWETMRIILEKDSNLFTKIYKPMMKNLNITFITGNTFEIIPHISVANSYLINV